MKAIWDGFLSALAAIATAVVCGLPGWAAFEALEAGLVPTWVYGPLIGLGFIGLLLTFAFARKAMKGIAPSRARRR